MQEKENKNLSNNGGYQNEDVLWHQHSNRLLIELIKYFPQEIPVIDLGCGHNWYCNTLRFFKYNTRGVDSTRLPGVDLFDDITDSKFREGFGNEIMNVISLEVGEHIPEHLSNSYLNNVASFNGAVLLSWAVPGQAGIGHINCRPNAWVINEMHNRGYKIDTQKTEALRGAVSNCHCSWFKNTLMYFTKIVFS